MKPGSGSHAIVITLRSEPLSGPGRSNHKKQGHVITDMPHQIKEIESCQKRTKYARPLSSSMRP